MAKRIDTLLREVLRATRVVDPTLQNAVLGAAEDYWGPVEEADVQVGAFRRGVLHVVFKSHARMAEAKSFLGDEFRERVNRRLSDGASNASSRREALYVSKLVFHVAGTF